MSAKTRLVDILRRYTREGLLYRVVDEQFIECTACGHRCKIRKGREGICKIRYNDNHRLMVPYGYTTGMQADPIEKKPFYHAYPGSKALSFGMLGCDLHCPFCQNWITSQALYLEAASAHLIPTKPEQVIQMAKTTRSRVLTSTYNEPLITAEWAVEIFKLGKAEGLVCSFVSNGNATPEVIEFLRPYIDLYKIDLKSFNDKTYRILGTRLKNVTNTIQTLHSMGIWVEIVTLLIPDFNNDKAELRAMAEFIASVSRDIPWHVTAFHPDYKMTDKDFTTPVMLIEAAQTGQEAGLRYVYTGNLPGMTGQWENTYCHECKALLIERSGFRIIQNRLNNGTCPSCHTVIPGRWS